MAKISDDAAEELPLNDERIEPKKLNRHIVNDERIEPKKLNRHIVIALNHMKVRRTQLMEKIDALTKERDDLDESIAALE
jgi:hypothetical protein